MTVRMIKWIGAAGAWVVATTLVFSAPSKAEDQDGLLARIHEISDQLASMQVKNPATTPGLRRQAVTLAQALKTLAFNEAERRSIGKVGPPAIAALRPGQEEIGDILDMPAGQPVRLRDVPDSWFNAKLESARDRTLELMAFLDSGQAERQDVEHAVRDISQRIQLINRPPLL